MIEWITLQGLAEYQPTLDLMHNRVEQIINNSNNEAVFLLEHSNVYTAGTAYKEGEDVIEDISIISSGRGGKLTYHGPGQRIIYPILHLSGEKKREKDLKLYINRLEQLIINTLLRLGIKSYTINGMVGIWINVKGEPAKIAAIGVRVKKWITYHGIAVNISTNLNRFSSIIPCGLSDFPVTSLYALGVEISLQDFDLLLKQEFKEIF